MVERIELRIGSIHPHRPVGLVPLAFAIMVGIASSTAGMPASPADMTDPAPTLHLEPSHDAFAAGLRGFGPLGILAILVVLAGNALLVPGSALLALLWAWRSRTPWRDIGYVRPASWLRVVLVGIVFGAAFKLAIKSIVMPLLGADPINQAYHHLAGNTAALPRMLFAVTVGAGFGEETVFRGYLFERLGRLLGSGRAATAAIVLVTAAWFGVVHYPEQGLPGAQQGWIVGLVFGSIYAVNKRIWFLMFAHTAFDLTALALIYWNLEADVAHIFFQ